MQKVIPLKQDLSGKIRNLKLNASHSLFPLYEMVVNSIQAIHEKKEEKGLIEIDIIRDAKGGSLALGDYINPIISFVISDNGVGFNNDNFDSFCTADTPYKLTLGCKGVGRFVALKAFEKITIDSDYFDEDTKRFLNRALVLSQKNGLIVNDPTPSKIHVYKTVTSLENCLPEFQKPATHSSIAKKLLDHCLIYFINGNAPEIVVYDNERKKEVRLLKLYQNFIQQDEVIDSFELRQRPFEIFYVKKYVEKGKHQVHYCADDREVVKKTLSKIIPDLKERLLDERGYYYLSIYVKSPFLDEKVYTERNLFNIPESNSKKKLFDLLSFEEIELELANKVRENYAQELQVISFGKKAEVENYVYRDGLEYRHLLGHEDLLDTIPPGLSDDRLDTELHKLNHKLEKQQKVKVNKFLANRNPVEDHVEYQEELRELLKQEQDFSQSKLATYLTRRKVIIKVLDRFLGIQSDGNFVYEKEIHNIIFPRYSDSNVLSYKEHNLWLLDERLTYHSYISSDKPIKTFSDSQSDEKPDLILFDKTFAFGESDNSSVVIFEFKRPMRQLTGKDKNVHDQVIGYVEDLMESSSINTRGRYTKVDAQTPKFGYIICDYSLEYEEYLIRFEDFNRTPKGTLFLYKKGINLMLEIMDYQALMADVDMRHKAFFREMGIDRL
jgi:hypothetical protein